MTNDEDQRERLARLEAAMKQHREVQESWLAMLDFDWTTAPRVDHGEVAGNPLGVQQPFSIELRNGRTIELREWHQYETYAGALAGVPPTPEGQLIAALKTARRVFPEFDGQPVVLEPVFHGGQIPRSPKNALYPIIWLPAVTTVARFESDAAASDPDEPYSTLVIAWFQDAFGLPKEPRTLDQLARIDWDSSASGWST